MASRNAARSTGYGWGRTWIVMVFLLLFALLSGCSPSSQQSTPSPRAENGTIDLREWSWKEDGIASLDGEWSFEWLESSGDNGENPNFTASTIDVPGTWDYEEMGNGSELRDYGYGIYRLTILHRNERDMMAIRLPNISTAYELSIDGEPMMSRGRADYQPDLTVPYQLPATVYFNARSDRTELKLVVANYDHRYGGIRTSIVMGDADRIQNLQTRHAAQELVILGALVMIGFYHLGLYVLRRKEIANLMFALLCLFVGLRMGLIGEGFIVRWIDEITWVLSIRLEYISLVLACWAGLVYFQSMYPLEIRRFWIKLSGGCAVLLVLFVLVASPSQFTSWVIAFQLYLLLFSTRVLIGLVLSAKRRREGAKLALIGVAGLVVTIINDILFYNGWSRSIDLVPFGQLFLIVMNSFIISLRFSLTHEKAERMSAQLIEWNSSLEERIEERTEELQRMEKSRTQLISNISHDLRTPITLLQGYLEALRDNVISEPAQRDKTIRSMLTKVEGLNSLIQDLFELSVLEARKVELSIENVPLSWWKERLMEQYGLEMQSKGINFFCRIEDDADEETTVAIDMRRMDRVFANLLYNAIRHTPEGGTIGITMASLRDMPFVEIKVVDSGLGIDQADLPHIFDRFYRKSDSRNSASGGSGLGLSIVKEIVELHGGLISAHNSEEGGGVFRILVPVTVR
ncbi:sensor histidine kinase [Cohnella terricola]|uniref:histidine kinase n=1 Tax=Cohnella terricola TaxID=1289167 RepID=A0A559JR33_9BACL|nr:sensor histidine kinase [Cohnella terricola]TVY02335.1 hypothetical protein FPZ45_07860 [Cohnella terricola]